MVSLSRKYYIYKYSEVKTVAKELDSDCIIKKGAYANNVRNAFKFYNEIRDEIQKDEELIKIVEENLDGSCYSDPQYRTLTLDIGFYISRYLPDTEEKTEEAWYPADYNPGLKEEDWVMLLKDTSVFNDSSLAIVKRLKDIGGEATCKQLAEKYGESVNYYNRGSSALAERIVKKTKCQMPPHREGDNSRWWPVLYVGRYPTKEEKGAYVWRLRDELSAAIDKVDMSDIALYAPDSQKPSNSVLQDARDIEKGYWWLNANPKIWSFSDVAVGETQAYSLYNENGNKRKVFQNFLDAKAGEIVIGYESTPVKQIVALACIAEENDGKNLPFRKLEGLETPIDLHDFKDSPELANMEYLKNPQGSLFKLTKSEYEFLIDLIRETNPKPLESQRETYSKFDFLSEVFMSEDRYEALAGILRNKKNIILQGAPGVGKTFAAKRLAYSLMGYKDDSRIEFVQFHQNYTYEDFIMGYKPEADGFRLRDGVFYRFCQRAANHPEKDYYFIIDEINRGNISKIFGELLMLIEKDYRGTPITLAYNGLSFTVPENIYIIGMMNTADRSLSLIDYALRRRFSFFDMEPGFDKEGFIRYQEHLDDELFDELIIRVKDLNKKIEADPSLGKGFCIGHSYFCGQEKCTEDWLRSVVDFDILPMLREYWFDDTKTLQNWENILNGTFQ